MTNEQPFSPLELPPLRTDRVSPKEIPISKLEIGSILTDQHGDRYTVNRMLGEGGYGSVYEITQARTGLGRALKVMRPDFGNLYSGIEWEKERKRFDREMDILSKLHNPFILPVIDVIELNVGGKKTVGFVTELVEGKTLMDEIDNEPKGIAPNVVIEIAGELAIALETLRKAGLVHRDIKPTNVFLQDMPDGKQIVRLGDFGLVRFQDLLDEEPGGVPLVMKPTFDKHEKRLTDVGMTVGSPIHMSPEQASGGIVGHQSDLYALGTVLYEMLSGRSVFNEKLSNNSIMWKHISETPKSFLEIGVTTVPVWLEAMVMKLLSKDPHDRYASAGEVFAVLKEGVKKDYPEMLDEIPFNWNIA